MLDCGLSSQTVLNFLPMPLVQSARFQSLPNWICPREHDAQIDGELKECCTRLFIDSAPEFNAPLDKIVDFSEVDIILISNYMNMMALPFITGTGYLIETTHIIDAFIYLQKILTYLCYRGHRIFGYSICNRANATNWSFFHGRIGRVY